MWRAIERLAEMVRTYSDSQVDLAYRDVTMRLARRLLELCREHGVETRSGVRIPLRVSQSTLAGMVGATREGVNRALGSLTRQGVLFSASGSITIIDMRALVRRAGTDGVESVRAIKRTA